MNLNNISIIGAGTMGNGIAHVFAMHGFPVCLCDISEDVLEKAMNTIEKNLWRMVAKEYISEQRKKEAIRNIETTTSINEAVERADLAIEAATEDLRLKLDIFSKIDESAPKETILASNTSSISITKIASVTDRPDQVLGMHFMNPVPVMKLVEIIEGYETLASTTQTIVEITKKIEKVPVIVKDYPGFISNRILMPMINEAIFALQEGVAGVNEIDSIMKLGMAHPMGPLQLADFIGLDVCLAILNVLYEGFGNPKYAPCPLLTNMVNSGNLGKKTGAGFYSYRGDSKRLNVSEQFQR